MQIFKTRLGMNVILGVFLMSTLLVVAGGIAQEPPDVAKILFESDRKVKKNKDIYIMNADGTDVERITDHAKADISPTWSPDGTRFAMAAVRDDSWEHIRVLSALDREEDMITITAGTRDLTPAWSPNGNWIACVHANVQDGWTFDVWIVRLQDEKKKMDAYKFSELGNGDEINSYRLTKHSAQDESPAWSADGLQIAWSSNRTGNYDIFVMDRTGGNKKNLTNHPKDDKGPDWQPPWGEKIVFASDRDGDSEIYTMDPNGGNVKQLTANVFVWDGQATWSPNGKEIAFATNRDRNNEIYVMDANGNNLVNLTNNKGSDQSPAWFDPKIAFSVSPKTKRTVTWGAIKQSGRKPAEK